MKPLTGKHETLLKRENMKPEQVNSEFVPPPSLTTPGKLKVFRSSTLAVADEDGGEYQSEKVLSCVCGAVSGRRCVCWGSVSLGPALAGWSPAGLEPIQAHNKSLPSPYELG